MRTKFIVTGMALAAGVPGTSVVVAQSLQIQEIQPSDQFIEPFSRISGIRELPGGDLLVADQTEKAIYRVNFDTGSYEMIGRNGAGPGEYELPLAILGLPGENSLVVDMANMRLAVMEPSGRIIETYPMMRDGSFLMPTHADANGSVYWRSTSVVFGAGGVRSAPSNSASLLRWTLGKSTFDTVATLAIPPRNATSGIRISGGSISGMPAPRPFRPSDAFAVATDGRVGIARSEPYHVEWIGIDGSVVAGPEVAYEPLRISTSDKEEWAERRSLQTMSMVMIGGSGGGGVTRTLPRPNLDEVEFPEYFPAFSEASVSYEGELWVQRYQSYSAPGPLYDVFDSSGELVRRVRLPAGRTLVGFGPHALYAQVQDEDDLQWLERYEI